MTTKLYGATAVNGGGTGAMDSIKYATLADGDICFVIDNGEDFYVFRWESSETTAESTPWTTNKVVLADDDAGDGAWVLTDFATDDLTIFGTFTLSGNLTTANFIAAISSNQTVAGMTSTNTAGQNLTFGQLVYMKSDGKMWKADADATTTTPAIAMAAENISANASGTFLRVGWARDDSWTWTVGGRLYVSVTAGGISQSVVGGSGDVSQPIGVAESATIIYFLPSMTDVTLV